MSRSRCIAIDMMGGDYGPRVTVPAIIKSLTAHPDLKLILVGNQEKIHARLDASASGVRNRIVVHHADDVIAMDEKPSAALRSKRDTSMRACLNLVKEGRAQACVSAGNTGALMAIGSHVLRKQQGLIRPAICSAIPTLKGHSYLLDLGANIECSAEHLSQFAIMGASLASAVDNIKQPRVALLNIGQEEIKGNAQVKEAAQLLQQSPLINYVGYVEGDVLFEGDADVIVCDGFTGNVALKTSEGVASFISKKIKRQLRGSVQKKVLAWLAMPVLSAIFKQLDARSLNGAVFLGLHGIVVKSHGKADAYSFSSAISLALSMANCGLAETIDNRLQALE